jgi:hypothetical protein
MAFYHYTSGHVLRAIARHGITVGDVPTDIHRFRGRIGAWLTSSDSATPRSLGLAGSGINKGAYRLTVEIHKPSSLLVRWVDWAPLNVTPETMKMLHDAASSPSKPSMPEGW